jgi:hypothetical protein
MASVLLDFVIGAQAKRPFIRKTWVDRNTTKRGYRLKQLETPAFYKPTDQLLYGSGFQPLYGYYSAGTGHLAVRGPAINMGAINSTTTSTNALMGSTDGSVWAAKNLVANLNYTGLTVFNNQIWVFTKTMIYTSTDLTGTSWTAGAAPLSTGFFKQVVFGSRVISCTQGVVNAVYSNLTPASYSTHTLPVSMQVTGMATDGTNLIVIGYATNGTGYVYRTTDLTNWTLMSVKMTSSDIELNGLASTVNTAVFAPVGITYTGSIFVIVAQDVMIGGRSINPYYLGAYRVYTGGPGLGFTAKSEIRLDGNNTGYSSKSLLNAYFAYQGKTQNCLTCDSSGRLAFAAVVHTQGYIDAQPYYAAAPVIAYSDDAGDSWTLSELPTQGLSEGFAANLGYIATSIYPSPNGFVAFFGCMDANAPDWYMTTNPNARELAIPY